MIIAYGVTEKGFCSVQKFENYYSFWMMDAKPKKINQSSMRQFLEEHENNGWGVAGTFEQVMNTLKDYLGKLDTPALDWTQN